MGRGVQAPPLRSAAAGTRPIGTNCASGSGDDSTCRRADLSTSSAPLSKTPGPVGRPLFAAGIAKAVPGLSRT